MSSRAQHAGSWPQPSSLRPQETVPARSLQGTILSQFADKANIINSFCSRQGLLKGQAGGLPPPARQRVHAPSAEGDRSKPGSSPLFFSFLSIRQEMVRRTQLCLGTLESCCSQLKQTQDGQVSLNIHEGALLRTQKHSGRRSARG